MKELVLNGTALDYSLPYLLQTGGRQSECSNDFWRPGCPRSANGTDVVHSPTEGYVCLLDVSHSESDFRRLACGDPSLSALSDVTVTVALTSLAVRLSAETRMVAISSTRRAATALSKDRQKHGIA